MVGITFFLIGHCRNQPLFFLGTTIFEVYIKICVIVTVETLQKQWFFFLMMFLLCLCLLSFNLMLLISGALIAEAPGPLGIQSLRFTASKFIDSIEVTVCQELILRTHKVPKASEAQGFQGSRP